MKNFTHLRKNRYFIKLKSRLTLLVLLISCYIFLFNNPLCAQESKIYQLTENESETISLLSKNPKINVDKVFDLIQNLPPMIYIEGNRIQMVTDSNPLVLVLMDVLSFDFLKNNNEYYNKVELLKIHINQQSDLNQKLDFSKISGFNELRYIYIQSSIECTESQIKLMILNSNSQTTILFKIIKSA